MNSEFDINDSDFIESLKESLYSELEREKVLVPNIPQLKLLNEIYEKLQKLFNSLNIEYTINVERLELLPCDVFVTINVKSGDFDMDKSKLLSYIEVLRAVDLFSESVKTDYTLDISLKIRNVFVEVDSE